MRTIQSGALALFFLLGMVANADEAEVANGEVAIILTRSDNLPLPEMKAPTDPYFEGYIQALVDQHYAEYGVIVLVKDRNVWLAGLPKNEMIAKSIAAFVKDVPGVKDVYVLDGVPEHDKELRQEYVRRPQITGIWFPQMTELFQPLIADPRNATYSIGWRSGDQV